MGSRSGTEGWGTVGEEHESIIVDRPRPGIMTVTLNRPAALNAINAVSSVESDGELVSGALDLAGSIVQHSPFGVWMTKEVMWSNLEVSGLRAAIDLENRTQILSSLTADRREAVEAFLEKRPAEFRNR